MSNILNVFTDASVKHNRFKTFTVGCPGFTLFIGDQLLVPGYYHYLMNSTNNESEITAILDALEYIYCNPIYFNTIDTINIFSDSKISIYGLREWYKKWVTRVIDNNMISSSGKPVANQRNFLHCINLITMMKKKVNFYHVNGHIDLNSNTSIAKFAHTFMRENNCIRTLTKNELDFLVNGNNAIDILTGVVDNFDVESEARNYKINPNKKTIIDIQEYINSLDFNLYSDLISDYRNLHIF